MNIYQVPRQPNFEDCGAYALSFVLLLAFKHNRFITDAGMNSFRANIQLQLLRHNLYPPEYENLTFKTGVSRITGLQKIKKGLQPRKA